MTLFKKNLFLYFILCQKITQLFFFLLFLVPIFLRWVLFSWQHCQVIFKTHLETPAFCYYYLIFYVCCISPGSSAHCESSLVQNSRLPVIDSIFTFSGDSLITNLWELGSCLVWTLNSQWLPHGWWSVQCQELKPINDDYWFLGKMFIKRFLEQNWS